ncbi:MAG: hypothetical protein HQL56_03585 [Magnetococcales bacterium]|nr:hypothetical protein [Magnetococcales bacterium]
MNKPLENWEERFQNKVIERWTRLEKRQERVATANRCLSWSEVDSLVKYRGEYSLPPEKLALLSREPYRTWFRDLSIQEGQEYGNTLAAAGTDTERAFRLAGEWERDLGTRSRLRLVLGDKAEVYIEVSYPGGNRESLDLLLLPEGTGAVEIPLQRVGEGQYHGEVEAGSPVISSLLDPRTEMKPQ